MRMRTSMAALMAAGLAASTAAAQDTLGGSGAATRSPSTSPIDAPPATNRGVVGNEVPGARGGLPGARIAPGNGVLGGVGSPGAGMMGGRPGGFALPPSASLDQIFAAAASSAGLSEVAMARLALQRGSSDEVKLFAQRMINDHSKANNELINLATTKGMSLPMTVEPGDRFAQMILTEKSGEEFDKGYIHQQLAAHMNAVALFEGEAARGRDPQLQAWAAKMLPALKDHKQQVKRMHDELSKEKSAANSR